MATKREESPSKEALNACVSEICDSIQETMGKGEALGCDGSKPGTPPTRNLRQYREYTRSRDKYNKFNIRTTNNGVSKLSKYFSA